MAIPDYQACMLPLLKLIASGEVFSMRIVAETLANQFELTPEERIEQLPSGKAKLFYNRVAWAKFYLKRADLLEAPKYGHIQITQKGKHVLSEELTSLNSKYLDAIIRGYD